MTDEQLAAIRARANAATPGPWTSYEKNPTDEYYASCFPADEEFIGHSRDDVPALLDEVERLRAALVSIRLEAFESGHTHGAGIIGKIADIAYAALDAAGGE